ncbi:RteC domain-containing protein [Chryseobacterium paludis]|uniref:RteC domain-containing protein n=1 Tax=Chryseobacterium paludis TaxID=2956784 RepID=UPI0021C173C4|nr:RteC domain-containing protein [Chryseobacterium paludis]
MKPTFRNTLKILKEEEERITLAPERVVTESRKMMTCLHEHLEKLKECVLKEGFENTEDEIEFFRTIKPLIFGKLLYYNKIFKIEAGRPVEVGNISQKYFKGKLEKLESYYIRDIAGTDFYKYYRSESTEKDEEYFVRGHLDLLPGARSRFFDADHRFSTYYDYEAARIIECELLYEYLHLRLSGQFDQSGNSLPENLGDKKFLWTESKNALIELIYALHASQSVGYGKLSIRQLVTLFQMVFNVQLGDANHAFHRMKFRTGDSYLDRLKSSLDSYKEKDL